MTDRTCGVPACERDYYARGWCQLHYDRARKHGSPELPQRERITGIPCSIDDCGKLAVGRGWCPMHWYRWKKHGSTDTPAGVTRPAECSLDGCTDAANVIGSAHGLCPRHYRQKHDKRRGTPRQRTFILPRPKQGPRTCSTSGCAKKHVAKGLCSWHYALTRRQDLAPCSVDGCAESEHAKGMCANHYAYNRRHGSPMPQFTCRGCGGNFPGRANTLHCTDCKPSPNAYAQVRKERLAANNASMTDADRQESAEYQAIIQLDPCVYCGGASVAIDHITPVVDGGSDRWENLAPVCKSCNSSKRSRSVLTLMLSRMAA
ncbi:HNH endonuclease [Streptomyces sp. NBC_01324]|uniref:HNH endonuclease n=1 Tax=Streptomyces sp. NBC_01324 TaxID=2903826 RepID=UPI002E151E99|nr:HNH endonuclease [Streptomyces sp. NBC_01324]